ncbi:hypothetical protein BDK51DRAFT_27977 [Blyttiomyces helicus]|uniref:Uncharacterized protein n=1 Tax=Blyttiomyces helicus TaxID=388810 RepID=A0A4P9WGG8_9FUNG|nr:hypothetical protein BDK51DRAFT_27977 [Blyttiomyces helicus]|eukprot:RKO91005.1 hypothetical protein BDK51DRAFT_27977 [Blyttiomyces helicus]
MLGNPPPVKKATATTGRMNFIVEDSCIGNSPGTSLIDTSAIVFRRWEGAVEKRRGDERIQLQPRLASKMETVLAPIYNASPWNSAQLEMRRWGSEESWSNLPLPQSTNVRSETRSAAHTHADFSPHPSDLLNLARNHAPDTPATLSLFLARA